MATFEQPCTLPSSQARAKYSAALESLCLTPGTRPSMQMRPSSLKAAPEPCTSAWAPAASTRLCPAWGLPSAKAFFQKGIESPGCGASMKPVATIVPKSPVQTLMWIRLSLRGVRAPSQLRFTRPSHPVRESRSMSGTQRFRMGTGRSLSQNSGTS